MEKKKRGRPKADQTMKQIAIRVHLSMIDRFDDLVEKLTVNPLVKVERSVLMREAMEKGLELLEKELAKKKK